MGKSVNYKKRELFQIYKINAVLVIVTQKGNLKVFTPMILPTDICIHIIILEMTMFDGFNKYSFWSVSK